MLSSKHIRTFAVFYLGCSVVSFLWYAWYSLTLSQQEPVFLLNKLDVTGNIMLSSGIAEDLVSSASLRLIADGLFFLLPIFLSIAVFRESRFLPVLSVFIAVYNMAYAYVFSIFTFVSIEVFTAWMLVPLVFASRNIRTSFYLLHMVRLIFLLIFFSTAIWKMRSGGIFNSDQLPAILLRQHASLLSAGPSYWFSDLVRFMIENRAVSHAVYLIAFLLEFIFILGFFTRRYDRMLMICFIFFLLFDYLLMEINYFSWVPFLGCLFFSHYEEPGSRDSDTFRHRSFHGRGV